MGGTRIRKRASGSWRLGAGANTLPEDFASPARAWLYALFRYRRPQRLAFLSAVRLLNSSGGQPSRNIVAAGAALAAAGLVTEATTTLLRRGLTADAARILASAGYHREAGSLLRRLGKWQEAAYQYWLAKAYDVAARCANRAKDHSMAADCYERSGELAMAGQMRARAGDLRAAARLFYRAGRGEAAAGAYIGWICRLEESDVRLQAVDIEALLEISVRHLHDLRLLGLLVKEGRGTELVLRLLAAGKSRLAAEVYTRCDPKQRQSMVAAAVRDSQLAEELVAMLRQAADHAAMGIVHEAQGRFREAAGAYRLGGQPEDAYRCSVICDDWSGARKIALRPHSESMIEARLTDRPLTSVSRPRPVGLLTASDRIVAAKSAAVDEGNSGAKAPGPVIEAISTPTRRPFLDAPFLGHLTPGERGRLWEIGHVRRFRKGAVIVDFNEAPAGTLTVLAGEVSIQKQDRESVALPLAASEPRSIGVSWSLLPLHSKVRVVATTDCDVHVLDRGRLTGLISGGDHASGPGLGNRLADGVIRHLYTSISGQPPVPQGGQKP